jgi:ethanolamine-phosphate cytidylyltransferase
MEKQFKSLTNEQLTYLLSYNVIKSDPLLQEISQNLELNDPYDNRIIEIKQKLSKEINNLRHQFTSQTVTSLSNKKVRIYMDGVFDIIHSGHFNAIRQSKKLGDVLVVGINSDSDVEKAKGPLLMKMNERSALVRSCKWVDEVVENTPYTPTISLLDELKIDYCAHGDDMPVNENGIGCYDEIKNAGRLRVFKRTEGISTTEIIGRLLSCSSGGKDEVCQPMTSSSLLKMDGFEKGPVISNFLTTGWRLTEFCNNKAPGPNDKIIYIDGSFDILHIGHVETLRKARELGDFLYVGVHDDKTVNTHRGNNYPILNLQERVFNLLSLKYVDDVVIAAPWKVTADLIKSLKISLVVEGTLTKYDDKEISSDPYEVPKSMGIYQQIESTCDLTNEVLVTRLVENRINYINKYLNKSAKEIEYYNSKTFINEI